MNTSRATRRCAAESSRVAVPRESIRPNAGRAGRVFGAVCLLAWGLLPSPAEGQVAVAYIPRPEEVDAAIERGLSYLLTVQAEDGSFDGKFGRSTGVVSLCGMAFLAKGYTPGYGRYGKAVERCIDYVLAHNRDGQGYFTADQSAHGPMYSHNIATLFLSEVSGMVDADRQKAVSAAIAAAVRTILAAQGVEKGDPHAGGWRYQRSSRDSDLSCSGWALMALRSARLNGAPVPDEAIEQARAYIMKRYDSGQGRFGYQDTSNSSETLTGAAVLCLELTGSHGDEVTRRAGNYMLNVYRRIPRDDFPYYGLYYNAQAAFQLGGRYWKRIASWMYDTWLPEQKADGSWPTPSHCWMAKHGKGDTAYITAMAVLSLAVPYRQLPIYQRDETVDEEVQ